MVNRLLLLFVAISVVMTSCKEVEKQPLKIPGSYKALDLFGHIRAYPNQDIPADGFYKGYEFHTKYMDKASYLKKEQSWEAAGPLNIAGRTLTIAVNPQDDQVIYAGSASGGLWRSRDLGLSHSWERISTGYPVLGVSTIEFAPGDSSTMYIGTGEVYNFSQTGNDAAYRSTRGSYGIGILKSTDGGQTWEKSLDWSYEQQRGVWMIKVSPINPNIVYAATTDGIYKSIDAGSRWSKVSNNIMGTDIDIDPRDDQKVVACFGNFNTPAKGLYYTEDGGGTWIRATGDIPTDFNGKILIARATSNPDVLYASIGNGFSFNDGFTWLLRSDDGGKTWDEKNRTDYSRWQGWFSHDVAISPQDENIITCVGIDIYKSTDGGATLERKSTGGVAFGRPPIVGADGPPNYSHSDHHFVSYHPNIEDLVLFGNDGGVFLSFTGSESFQSANGGYQSTQFYNGFSVSHQSGDFALGGLQDNSTVLYRGDGEWQRAIGGDGSWTGINFDNDSIVYGSWQNLNLNRSENKGFSFSYIGPQLANGDSPLFISPYVVSQSEPNILYAGGLFVYKSVNGGLDWETQNGNFPINGDPVFCMAVSPENSNIIYVGTVGQNVPAAVFVSMDGGQSFIETSGLPNRIPNDIAIDPKNPATAYVVLSGFGTKHIYQTNDFGLSWTPIDGILPDIPGNAIVVDPESPNILYYGNDLGVYASENYGTDWYALDQGLPTAVIAMELTVSPTDRKLWVATHGNGTYRTDMIEGYVSTEDLTENRELKIYPNPTSDILNIVNENYSDLNWLIYDMQGQVLKTGQDLHINVSDLTDANYILKIQNDKEVSTQIFSVQR